MAATMAKSTPDPTMAVTTFLKEIPSWVENALIRAGSSSQTQNPKEQANAVMWSLAMKEHLETTALEEGFLLLPGAPIGLLTGAVAGAVAATRAAQRLGAKCISESERGGKRRLILALVMSIPAAFISVAWIAKEAVGSTHPRKLVSFL